MKRAEVAPLISAIVCTRDRAAYLAKCLRALERQTLEQMRYEVIIVDNGSTDNTRALAEQVCHDHANFSYLYEGRPGLSIARNLGVRRSLAQIVAFTDDDAEPAADWLERLSRCFLDSRVEIGVAGGDVVPVWEAPRPPWLSDDLLRPLSAGLHWSPKARLLRPGEWIVEVNCAYSKAALLGVGGFPEHLGRIGNVLLSGDGGINLLVERAGYAIYYDPAILVRHHIPSSRLTKAWFRRRSFWQGVTLNILHRYVEETASRLGLPPEPGHARRWEELQVPVSVAGWVDLFDNDTEASFPDQLYRLECVGYLLESQSVLIGR